MTNSEKNTILFTLVYRGEEWPVQTRRNHYYSLMSLIADYLPISGFGICSGMGSCGTCAVSIDGMRCLSCDVAIDDELANARIVIEEAYF
ncbi:hypothetical protein [Larkinella rosea]|uniref:2Fe-2S ferredoxin-type domain-containing protein n=1 Tax=Larkinella rosea TaxID=2025312 RepID=A0A3P1BJ27_9BACT|nr:hypothetical protein [Larkinella rosea]RRB01120.1 hypothetical protein EHT25_23385 [Larkinella rosea]